MGTERVCLPTKYLLLCSTEERKSYWFETTWGWVNDDRIFIYGWTIPLSVAYVSKNVLGPVTVYSICHKLHVQKRHVDLIILNNVNHSTLTTPRLLSDTEISHVVRHTSAPSSLERPLKKPSVCWHTAQWKKPKRPVPGSSVQISCWLQRKLAIHWWLLSKRRHLVSARVFSVGGHKHSVSWSFVHFSGRAVPVTWSCFAF